MNDLHTCISCGNTFEGSYCNNCGEKVHSEKDKTFYHFIEDAIHFLTHLDGTLFNTLKAMATKPGLLSEDYCNGKRRKYFKPLSLFLTLIIIYLLFPLFQGLDMTLYNNIHEFFGGFASQKVNALMHDKSLTFDQIATIYSEKSEKVSKFLLIILVPVSALFFFLFFHRKRKYFYDHLVFTTEINCVFLLWGFLILPLITLTINSFSYAFTKTYLIGDSSWLLVIAYGVLGFYTCIAVRRFYKIQIWKVILFTLLFITFHFYFVFIVYKFILFAVTIYLV